MPLSRRDPANLWDMLEAAEKVQDFLKQKTFEDFMQDDMLRAAVERNLEIIGEAARRISEELKQEHPGIPWRKIIAQRNVLIHEYDDIDYKEIWKVASFHVPRLIDQIRPLIPPLPPEVDEKDASKVISIEKEIKFERFIGIDWSGAKKPGRGIQVAQCFSGKNFPEIINNRKQQNWRRKDIIDWLAELHHDGQRVLVGFDFAFAYPYCDKGAYFPEHKRSPKTVDALWKTIDAICHDSIDFYGGPFYKPQDAMFGEYLHYPLKKGKRYEDRFRKTDASCKKIKGCVPASVFKCLGAASVGIGSIAGMRMLHHIKTHLNKDFQIWPFEKENNGRSVIVEIYPTLFYRLSGQNTRNWQNHETVNKALKYFGSDPLPSDLRVELKDQIDAIISAAPIRHLANNPNTWYRAELKECARVYEGWILGVE